MRVKRLKRFDGLQEQGKYDPSEQKVPYVGQANLEILSKIAY